MREQLNEEGIVTLKINFDGQHDENQTFSSNKEGVLLSRVLNLVNEFPWPKSNVSVHYTTKTSEDRNGNSLIMKEPENIKARVTDLPVPVLLKIFSMLDVISLCRVSKTCQSWYNIANDELLWQKKLGCDSHRWEMVDHLSHPETHFEMNPESTFKEIYLQCCPECRIKREKTSMLPSLPKLGFYFGFSNPKVAMFGSGLDRNGFVKKLLWDKHSPFVVQKMFPGQFEGLGSGFTLSYSSGSIDLTTLYRMSKAERENEQNPNERVSKLLIADTEDEGQLTLSHPARQLCSTIDAFVYVVKADDIDKVCFGSDELKAMLDERWSQPKVPLLVLCLKSDTTVQAVPSITVADQLSLRSLSRPWQVRQCDVRSMNGILPGVHWFTKRIMSS